MPKKWVEQQVLNFSMSRLRLSRHLAFANNTEVGQKEANERAKRAGVADVPGKEKEKGDNKIKSNYFKKKTLAKGERDPFDQAYQNCQFLT